MRTPRTLVGLILVVTLISLSLAADAQPSRMPRVGWVGNGRPEQNSASLQAFREGLQQRGWREHQTVAIEYRWAEGKLDRLPSLVDELVRLKVDVIVLSGSAAIRAARAHTAAVPVVFVSLADPVTAGFVTSLARPGGKLTGVASEFELLIAKQLQLLKETVPAMTRVAVLYRPEIAGAVLAGAERAARELGLRALTLKAASAADFEAAFGTARREGAGAIQVLPSPFFNSQRRALIDLAARYRLPAMYEFDDYVEDGGLMSYGPDISAMFRASASHVDRILKGAKPSELPVERPSTFEFAINRKTAAGLGLSIPPAVLARADRVIE